MKEDLLQRREWWIICPVRQSGVCLWSKAYIALDGEIEYWIREVFEREKFTGNTLLGRGEVQGLERNVQVKGHLRGARISEVEGPHPWNGDSLGKSCACANAGFDSGKEESPYQMLPVESSDRFSHLGLSIDANQRFLGRIYTRIIHVGLILSE
jgi:hypothetical protein